MLCNGDDVYFTAINTLGASNYTLNGFSATYDGTRYILVAEYCESGIGIPTLTDFTDSTLVSSVIPGKDVVYRLKVGLSPCASSTQVDSVITIMPGSDLMAPSSATDTTICEGDSVQLESFSTGGVPTLTYNWTPAANLSNNSIEDPYASPVANTTYTLLIQDGNGCGATETYIVNVDTSASCDGGGSNDTTGIEDLINQDLIAVYPVPARSQLHVDLGPNMPQDVQIVMLDMVGNRVYKMRSEGQKNSIPVHSFERGVYLIRVESIKTRTAFTRKVLLH